MSSPVVWHDTNIHTHEAPKLHKLQHYTIWTVIVPPLQQYPYPVSYFLTTPQTTFSHIPPSKLEALHSHRTDYSAIHMAHSRRFQEISNRIAPPSHRHAAPSAPWPWVDIQDDSKYPKTCNVIIFSSQISAKKLIVGNLRPRSPTPLLHVIIMPVITVGRIIRNHYSPTGPLLRSRKAKLA